MLKRKLSWPQWLASLAFVLSIAAPRVARAGWECHQPEAKRALFRAIAKETGQQDPYPRDTTPALKGSVFNSLKRAELAGLGFSDFWYAGANIGKRASLVVKKNNTGSAGVRVLLCGYQVPVSWTNAATMKTALYNLKESDLVAAKSGSATLEANAPTGKAVTVQVTNLDSTRSMIWFAIVEPSSFVRTLGYDIQAIVE